MSLKKERKANWDRLKKEVAWSRLLPDKYHRWLVGKYKSEGKNFAFTSHEAIEDIENFPIADFKTAREIYRAYAHALGHAQHVFRRHRDMIPLGARAFVLDGQYKEYLENGHNIEQIWEKFNEVMLGYQIIPVVSDPSDEHKYKLMDVVDYIDHLESLAKRFSTGLRRVGTNLYDTSRALPAIRDKFVKPIADDHEHLALEWAKRFDCSHCDRTFVGEENYQSHLERRHPEIPDLVNHHNKEHSD